MTRRTIDLKVTPSFLAMLLRLDPSMQIVGARTETSHGLPLLVFAVDAPNAPNGAREMLPGYARDAFPDPVRLTHVEWQLRTGETVRQSFLPPAAEVSDG